MLHNSTAAWGAVPSAGSSVYKYTRIYQRKGPFTQFIYESDVLGWITCSLWRHLLCSSVRAVCYTLGNLRLQAVTSTSPSAFSLPLLFFQHPCIQKESHYIKFLCCEDEHTLLLWVNSIRIAKVWLNTAKNETHFNVTLCLFYREQKGMCKDQYINISSLCLCLLCLCVQYGTALYENYQAAMRRISSLQTLRSAAHKGQSTHAEQIS